MLEDCSLAILGGGAGRRLGGVPKGLLVLDGRTFLERLLALRELFADAFVVASGTAPEEGFGVRHIADAWIGAGTPGAVTTALCEAKTEWTFIAAVDMPLLSAAAVRELAAARSADVDVVAPLLDGRVGPLGAFYRSALCEPFGARLDEADPVPSVLALQSIARVRTVSPADPRAFTNVNTEEDLEAIGASRPSAW